TAPSRSCWMPRVWTSPTGRRRRRPAGLRRGTLNGAGARPRPDLMPDTKITDLAAYSTAHADDLLCAVDVHDTSMAASGTDKRMTLAQSMPTVQANGTGLTQRITINFTGSLIALDDSGNSRTTITSVNPVEVALCGAP